MEAQETTFPFKSGQICTDESSPKKKLNRVCIRSQISTIALVEIVSEIVFKFSSLSWVAEISNDLHLARTYRLILSYNSIYTQV